MTRAALLCLGLLVGCGASGRVTSDVATDAGVDATVVPDATTALDATVAVDAPPPDLPDVGPDAIAAPGTCGFEVAGSVQASIIGGTPSACACGTGIPFILFSCTATVAGTTYEFSADYAGMEEGGTLVVGSDSFTDTTPATQCNAQAYVNGAPEGAGGYKVGDSFAVLFACDALAGGDGGVVSITNGTLATTIGAKP